MSSPSAPRPGAPRRPGAPSAAASTARPSGPSIAEINQLPEFSEDGVAVNLDPSLASSGRLGSMASGESAAIVAAKFAKFQYPGRDDIAPETSLFVSFRRAGSDPESKPYEERFTWGQFSIFAPTKDGNNVQVRKSVVDAKSGYAPKPRKNDTGVMFLQSIKDAGGTDIINKVNTDGISALVGLQVHVRQRTVEGRKKTVLLVDYLEGAAGSTPASSNPSPASVAQVAAPATETAPLATATDSSKIDGLAEAAMLDVLAAAENNTIVRNQIPAKIIGIDKWRDHADRQQILQKLRDNAFMTREGAPWTVKGTSVILG